MTNSIDNKVVAVKFDNRGFSEKIADTIKNLDIFKTKLLNFTGSAKGLEDVQGSINKLNFKNPTDAVGGFQGAVDKVNFNAPAASVGTLQGAVNKFDMSPMATTIEGINVKLAAMATIGITALSNLVSKTQESAAMMTKSLTIAPVTSGLSEYELKLGSIQTIMAGSGENLDTVNRKLAELNAYSDKTIYSFKDMTSNIGKFTNAGVSLDDSVASIQGVANVAAISGANAEEASRAMYNFAQALSSGSVKLMDWKSIELANMGTVEFKQQLIDSAEAMGTLTKEGDHWVTSAGNSVTATKGFNESLADQWLSSEALTTTLGRYSDTTTDIGKRATAAAQDVKTFSQMMDTLRESAGSGWAATGEIIFGNFDEAKQLWTGMNNFIGGIIGRSADARNELLTGWKFFGGRDVLIWAMADALKALGSVLTPIKEAFRDIFPKKTALDLAKLTESFAIFVNKLILNKESMAKVRIIFWGFFSVLKIGVDIIKGIAHVFGAMVGAITGGKAGSIISDLAVKFALFFVKLQQGVLTGEGIAAFFQKIGTVAASAVNVISVVLDALGTVILTLGKALLSVGKAIAGFFETLFGDIKIGGGGGKDSKSEKIRETGEQATLLGKILEGAKRIFEKFVSVLEVIATGIGEGAAKIAGFFTDLTTSAASGVSSVASTSADVVTKVANFFGSLVTGIFNGAKTIVETILGIPKAVAEFFGQFGNQMGDAIASDGFDKVITVLKLLLGGKLLQVIDNFLTNGPPIISQFKQIMEEFGDTLKAFQLKLKADALKSLAIAIAILVASIYVISTMDLVALAQGVATIGVLMGGLTVALGLLDKFTQMSSGLKMAGVGVALVGLSAGVLLLAFALERVGKLNLGEIGRGLLGVTAMVILLTAASRFMGNQTAGLIRSGFAMIGMSVAILIMASALKAIGNLDLGQLAKGIIAIGIAMFILTESMNRMGDDKSAAAKGLAVLLIVYSLKKMAEIIEMFANIDTDSMVRGLLRITATLGILVLTLEALDKTDPIKGAIALGVVALALMLLQKAISMFGNMDWDKMKQGLLGVAATLLMVVGAAWALEGMGTEVAVTMVAFAGALFVLFKVVEQFGNLSVAQLVTGLIGMALAIGIVVGAAAILQYSGLMVALNALAMGLLAIGAAAALFGVAAYLIVDSFLKLGEGGKKSIDLIIYGIHEFVKLIPELSGVLAKALVDMATEFLSAGPAFVEAIGDIVMSILKELQTLIPEGARVMSLVIQGLIQVIRDNIPGIVMMGIELLMALLRGLDQNMFEISNRVISIIGQLVQALTDNADRIVEGAVNLLTTFLNAFGEHADDIATAALGVLTTFLEAITENVEDVATAVGTLITTLITELGKQADRIATAATEALTTFLAGLAEDVEAIGDAVFLLVDTIITELGELGELLTGAGADALISFLEGLNEDVEPVADAIGTLLVTMVTELGKQALRLAAGMIQTLIDVMDGVRKIIDEDGSDLRNSAIKLGGAILNALSGGIAARATGFVEDLLKDIGGWLQSGWDFATSWIPGGGKSSGSGNKEGPGKSTKDAFDKGKTAGKTAAKDFVDTVTNAAKTALDSDKSVETAASKMIDRAVKAVSSAKAVTAIQAAVSATWAGTDPAAAAARASETEAQRMARIQAEVANTWAEGNRRNTAVVVRGAQSQADRMAEIQRHVTETWNEQSNAQATAIPEHVTRIAAATAEATTAVVKPAAADTGNALATELNTTVSNKANAQRTWHAGGILGKALVNGFIAGIRGKANELVTSAMDVVRVMVQAIKDFLEIKSPSRVFVEIGEFMTMGMANAFDNDTVASNSAVGFAKKITDRFRDSMSKINESVGGLDDLNPVISPVLDLTNVESEAKRILGMLDIVDINPHSSYKRARFIAHTKDTNKDQTQTPIVQTKDVKFEQHIYSPKSLAASDIYRNTKSQIVLAKEELNIS